MRRLPIRIHVPLLNTLVLLLVTPSLTPAPTLAHATALATPPPPAAGAAVFTYTTTRTLLRVHVGTAAPALHVANLNLGPLNSTSPLDATNATTPVDLADGPDANTTATTTAPCTSPTGLPPPTPANDTAGATASAQGGPTPTVGLKSGDFTGAGVAISGRGGLVMAMAIVAAAAAVVL
ncbi:hypothetical protein B0A49_04938 [Cryomyces minteri]|uniref:Uncharacterized protein n=1 Tax=Cryomyces minteri TaxID=331657 RepID=A0A4U0XC19_9PEZI|nr:hypothetical protein B0A49_04938 [Cryomyces minteri]